MLPASKLSCLGERSEPRENARARGRERARLASLAQIGELARKLVTMATSFKT